MVLFLKRAAVQAQFNARRAGAAQPGDLLLPPLEPTPAQLSQQAQALLEELFLGTMLGSYLFAFGLPGEGLAGQLRAACFQLPPLPGVLSRAPLQVLLACLQRLHARQERLFLFLQVLSKRIQLRGKVTAVLSPALPCLPQALCLLRPLQALAAQCTALAAQVAARC